MDNVWVTKENQFSRNVSQILKSCFDFTVALIGIIFLLPFLGIIALLIKLDSHGPVFFLCHRTGLGGRVFRMAKFRTMYERPSSYAGPRITCKEDERITPFGHWLRDSKVNELPQLWNVLIGQMSLVGPRPEDPEIAATWPVDAFNEILSVKPGITSPASILYHDEENLLSSSNLMGDYLHKVLPDKMRLDRLYVHNRSFWSDLDIIFWTVAVIVPYIARAKIPERYLFGGPIYQLYKHYLSWFVIDSLTCLTIIGVTGILWRSQGPLDWGIWNLALLSVILALLFGGINSLIGLDRIDWTRATIEDAILLSVSSLSLMVGLLVFDFLQSIFHWFSLPALPPFFLITISLMTQTGFLISRFHLNLLSALANCWLGWRKTKPTAGERVLIVGTGETVENAIWLMKQGNLGYAYQIIGIVDDQVRNQNGMRIYGYPILGQVKSLPELIKKHRVSLILNINPENNPVIQKMIFSTAGEQSIRLICLERLMQFIDQHLNHGSIVQGGEALYETEQARFAMYDDHTGLPSLYLFKDRLRHSLAIANREHINLAVLIINLDGENETQAHKQSGANNIVKREFVRRMTPYVRASDTFANIGGNRFALILVNIDLSKGIEKITHRISSCFEQPLPNHPASYQPFVEVTSYTGDDIKEYFLSN